MSYNDNNSSNDRLINLRKKIIIRSNSKKKFVSFLEMRSYLKSPGKIGENAYYVHSKAGNYKLQVSPALFA